MFNRWAGWLLQLGIITLLLGLQTVDLDRRILLALAALCFAVAALRWRQIADRVTRLWVSFGLAELFVAFLWSCLNIVRGNTYGDAHDPPYSGLAVYGTVVDIQDILLPWTALLIAILFPIALFIKRKSSTGHNSANA